MRKSLSDPVVQADGLVKTFGATRALDGRQQASWDGFEASWTYHPDNGLTLILRETA